MAELNLKTKQQHLNTENIAKNSPNVSPRSGLCLDSLQLSRGRLGGIVPAKHCKANCYCNYRQL